jgi:16S rRNA processing protein RimM
VITREGAEALTGTKLYVPRDRLPEAEEGAWYHSDLIGLAAYDASEVQIGTVVGVHNFGAGDIIEVSLVAGGDTILLPFTDATVPDIDTEERRITLVLPKTDTDEGER